MQPSQRRIALFETRGQGGIVLRLGVAIPQTYIVQRNGQTLYEGNAEQAVELFIALSHAVIDKRVNGDEDADVGT